MSRKPKLTPEVQKIICDNIRLGMTYKLACMGARVSDATFFSWKAKAEKPKARKIYVEFLDAVKQAESEYIQIGLATIRREAINGTWQAAAWLLERRYPQEYGQLKRDPLGSEQITVVFNRPERNPDEKGDSIEGAISDALK